MLYRLSYKHYLNVFRVVSLMQGQSCHYVPLRGRWTRDRQVNRTVGSERWSETDAQVDSELDRQSWFPVQGTKGRERHTNRGDVWVYKRPPVVLSETDDLAGQSWAYTPPVIVTVWDNTAAQERFGRNFLGGSMWCYWIDWDPETYSL